MSDTVKNRNRSFIAHSWKQAFPSLGFPVLCYFNKHKIRCLQLTWVYTVSYRDCIILHFSLLQTIWKVFLSREHFLPGRQQCMSQNKRPESRTAFPKQLGSWNAGPAASLQGRDFGPLERASQGLTGMAKRHGLPAKLLPPSHHLVVKGTSSEKTLLGCLG